MILDLKFELTTDESGDATETSTSSYFGRVLAIEHDFTGLAATADTTIDVIGSPGGVTRVLATFTNSQGSGFADVTADAIGATGAASGTDVPPFIAGKPRVTIAQGGNAASATVVLYIDDMRQ